MKANLGITYISAQAWQNFKKEWASWVLLAAGGLVLMAVSIAIHVCVPEYSHIALLCLCFPGAVYTAVLHKNGLDAAYGRQLNLWRITPGILFASLFFIAISLYNPLFPEYASSVPFLDVPASDYMFAINIAIHIIISYLLIRCMFVGMILLEEKTTVVSAFSKSFRLTSGRFFSLFAVLIYLAILLACSVLTIVGYCVILPYTILMKTLLFKRLNEMEQ